MNLQYFNTHVSAVLRDLIKLLLSDALQQLLLSFP